jgi:hypothetical protein
LLSTGGTSYDDFRSAIKLIEAAKAGAESRTTQARAAKPDRTNVIVIKAPP